MNCLELHSKWLNETITLDEIKQYADCTLEVLNEYDAGTLLIEQVLDHQGLQMIMNSTPKTILKMQRENMDSWFSILSISLDEENFELCAKIKKITDISETLLISAIYKYRPELFNDKFLSYIININEFNNKVITNDI